MNPATDQGEILSFESTEELQKHMLRMRMLLRIAVPNAASPLSRRETEIMRHVAEGKPRSCIAKELFVDIETVKSHIKTIYKKLNVHLKDDAIRVATTRSYI